MAVIKLKNPNSALEPVIISQPGGGEPVIEVDEDTGQDSVIIPGNVTVQGNLTVNGTGGGGGATTLTLTSPNNTKYQVTITDDGTLQTTQL
jgi:hypothetical protein